MAGALQLVRDAVVAELNGAGQQVFGSHWVPATPQWFDATDQQDQGTKIIVVPDGKRTSRQTRNSQQIIVDLVVMVTKGLPDDTISDVDQLCEMLEKIEAYYYSVKGIASPKASLAASQIQLPSRKNLNKSRRFYGFTQLSFMLLEF